MYLRLLLWPISLIYSAAAGMRNFLFDVGLFKKHVFNVPIILVGNLNVGGTGKTPHVEYLIRMLQSRYRIATLSRGYGRKSKGCVIAGKGATAEIIGDEPMQYFNKFNNITVSVCEDRAAGINKLLKLPVVPQIILMDDGFQHRSVDPGMKILLTAFDKPFTRDFVLPAGDLRESRGGYRRANCIVVTRTPQNITPERKERMIKKIKPLKHQQVFFSSISYENPNAFFSNDVISMEELSKCNIVLFSGIANPTALLKFIKSITTSFTSIKFPDHHDYSVKDMKSIKEKFIKFAPAKSIILTTEKDYLRLKGTQSMDVIKELPCYYIPVTVKIDRAEEFKKLITDRLTFFNA